MIEALKTDIVDKIGKYIPLKKVSAHEWASACPRCGGQDRFRVNDQRGWFCRQCQGEPGGAGHWGDYADFTSFAFGWSLKETLHSIGADRRLTPEELRQFEDERRAAEQKQREEEARQQEEVHNALTMCESWKVYNDNLDAFPAARELWHQRGLSDAWIEYYRVGFSPNRRYGSDGIYFESPSLTIPYFSIVDFDNPAWSVVGLQHRLLISNAPGGKYRPEMAGAGKQIFYTDLYQRSIFGDLLIVEGEIKAMITWSALWDGYEPLRPNLTVIGIPGKGWKQEWADQFNRADRVYICLDPDAQGSAKKLMALINKPVKNIILPDKIDDLINIGALDGMKLIEIMEGL